MLVRPAGLVATAGTAAAAVLGSGILALGHLERVAAAAGGDDVRIVEREAARVPEPRAAAALDGEAENGRLTVGLVGHQRGDLGGGPLGERDKSDRAFGELHLDRIVAACPALTPAPRNDVLDTTL